ncbi:uncharacterized protein BJ171DRAFT_489060 [Polychytrium aggregatum]|uniref:uncharacterized protein n=1 Tax=Polychytrium aggregatum TaxID=110093 RepID=UPI0022FE05A3|nr:uncharacterized protein BJ171DRAFT_489060 [Polychytrium aggregatum]KAI9208488.1 hypothetical protein BJ171DRAFT_489060 [Polychytrium aggregatum]
MKWEANSSALAQQSRLFLFSSSTETDVALCSLRGLDDVPDPALALASQVSPSPGDDLSPPNAVSYASLNAVLLSSAATAGWSSTPPAEIYPSAIECHLSVTSDQSLLVRQTCEFVNPNPGESMVVKLKVAKTMVSQQGSLDLVSTVFHEWVDDKWVDISTTISYSQTAEAVVTAVLSDPNAGQTAGRASLSDEAVEVEIGPIASRGRVILGYMCRTLHSYDAMSTDPAASDIGSTKLLPLMVFLPWAQFSHRSGETTLSVSMNAPGHMALLSPESSPLPFRHLLNESELRSSSVIAVTETSIRRDSAAIGFSKTWQTLPPKPCSLMFWLQITNPDLDDFVVVPNELPPAPVASATIWVPEPSDAGQLTVSMPGLGTHDSLLRLKLKAPGATSFADNSTRLILNMVFSDSSGSTGARAVSTPGSFETVRESFNKIAEARLIKRLEAIPLLVSSGLLRRHDIWTDAFFAFDHSVIKHTTLTFVVGEYLDAAIDLATLETAKTGSGSDSVASRIRRILQDIRGLKPSGGTSFDVPLNDAVTKFHSVYTAEANRLKTKLGDLVTTTFVDFDTDGGHNGSKEYCYRAVRSLVDTCNVRNGVVTGFGAWVDQECASKVASLLGTVPALLSMKALAPGDEGLSKVFRRGFSAWIQAVRHCPSKVAVDAQAVVVNHPRLGTQSLDGLQVLALERIKTVGKCGFDVPDVSEVDFAGTVLSDISAGDEMVLYVISKLPAEELKTRLRFKVNGTLTTVAVELAHEPMMGQALAYEWLKTVTKTAADQAINTSVASPHLLSRIEDDLSFGFNVPSPSGATAYLGRAKTTLNRPAIDRAHRPAEPKLPRWAVPRPEAHFGLGSTLYSANSAPYKRGLGQIPLGSSAFSFGGPVMAAAPRAAFGSGSRGGARSRSSAPGSARLTSPAVASSPMSFGSPAAAATFGLAIPTSSAVSSPFDLDKAEESTSPKFSHWSVLVSNTKANLVHSPVEIEASLLSLRSSALKINAGSLEYHCDVCEQSIGAGRTRWHCLDCLDFDECDQCHSSRPHSASKPLHRIRAISVGTAAQPAAPEDPLVASLLGAATTEPDTKTNWAGVRDMSHVAAIGQVKRFLMVMLLWWNLLRLDLDSRASGKTSFPEELPADLVSSIREALAEDSGKKRGEVSLVCVDSIERQLKGDSR